MFPSSRPSTKGDWDQTWALTHASCSQVVKHLQIISTHFSARCSCDFMESEIEASCVLQSFLWNIVCGPVVKSFIFVTGSSSCVTLFSILWALSKLCGLHVNSKSQCYTSLRVTTNQTRPNQNKADTVQRTNCSAVTFHFTALWLLSVLTMLFFSNI